MLHKAVREWLSEYKTLCEDEVLSFSQMLWQNKELIDALYRLFDSKQISENLDPVCHQLFEFYRSNSSDLRRFSLEFLPCTIYFYLSSLSQNEKKITCFLRSEHPESYFSWCDGSSDRSLMVDPLSYFSFHDWCDMNCGGVEAFLLGIYNLEIVDSASNPKINTFRIPSFGQPSVYHEPLSLSNMQPLTESALSRFTLSQDVWKSGPHSEFESINGQNRPAILAYLMECYNNHIVTFTSQSHRSLCVTASRIARMGFSRRMFSHPSDLDSLAPCETRNGMQPESVIPRIPVNPALLVEMLSGVYYVMFNGQTTIATHAVEDIHSRAGYEMFADVQLQNDTLTVLTLRRRIFLQRDRTRRPPHIRWFLNHLASLCKTKNVTSAILNSLKFSPSSQPEDGPMGISVAISTNTGIAKSAITNASFRAKKLPDDISVPTAAEPKLAPIEEDGDNANVNANQTQSKPGKSSGKKAKKDKEREKVKAKEKATRKDSDASVGGTEGGGRSLVTNGDTVVESVSVSVVQNQSRAVVDSIVVSVVQNQSRAVVDSIEMTAVTKTAVVAQQDEYVVANGNEEGVQAEMPKIVVASPSAHKELKNGPVNAETLSTDL